MAVLPDILRCLSKGSKGQKVKTLDRVQLILTTHNLVRDIGYRDVKTRPKFDIVTLYLFFHVLCDIILRNEVDRLSFMELLANPNKREDIDPANVTNSFYDPVSQKGMYTHGITVVIAKRSSCHYTCDYPTPCICSNIVWYILYCAHMIALVSIFLSYYHRST